MSETFDQGEESIAKFNKLQEAITNGSLSVETILANSDKLIERSEPFASVPPPQRELFLKSKKSTRISRVLSGPGVFLVRSGFLKLDLEGQGVETDKIPGN
jgi:hypothetical protein